jgi:hypothetical protein
MLLLFAGRIEARPPSHIWVTENFYRSMSLGERRAQPRAGQSA